MADEFDTFDASYTRDIYDRVNHLKELNEEVISRKQARRDREQKARELIAEQEAAAEEEDAQTGTEDTTTPDKTGEEGEDTSIVSDFFTGVVGGLRDAGVNTAQTVLDLGGAVDSGIDLDALIPDVEDRDSITFALAKGATQFLSAFVPALGAIRALRGVGVVSRALSAARGSRFGRHFTRINPKTGLPELGLITRDATAGAVADFLVFNPQEARFSDLLQDLGVDNPITNFLAADENDSAAKGRLKNVLEGLGLGLIADGIIRAAVASRGVKKVFTDLIDADVDPGTAQAAKSIQESVIFERQRLDELETILESWDEAAADAFDPIIAEARAGGDALSDAANQALEAAELRGQTIDEFGAPFDQAARDASAIEEVRSSNPALAQRLQDSQGAAKVQLVTERDAVLAELKNAEDALFNFQESVDYQLFPRKSRKAFEATLAEFKPKRARKAIKAIEEGLPERAPARAVSDDELPPQKITPDDVVGQGDAVQPTTVRGAKAADDAEEIVDMERLQTHMKQEREAGRGSARMTGDMVSTTEPVFARALKAALAKNRGGEVDVEAVARVVGTNLNLQRLAAPGGFLQATGELAQIVRLRSNLSPKMGFEETRALSRVKAQEWVNELGQPERAGEFLDNFERYFKDNVETLNVQLDAVRIISEVAKEKGLALAHKIRAGGLVSQAEFLFSIDILARIENIRHGYASSAGRTLVSMKQKINIVPITDKLGFEGRLAVEGIVDQAGGSQAIIDLADNFVDAFENPSALADMLGNVGRATIARKMSMEFWMNALLGSPITQFVNNFSNALVSVWTAGEMWIDGARAGNTAVMQTALKQLQGMGAGFRMSLRMVSTERASYFANLRGQFTGKPGAFLAADLNMAAAGDNVGTAFRSFATGEPQLIQGAKQFDFDEANAITAANARAFFKTDIKFLQEDGLGGRIINAFGMGVRLPTRLLTTGDELAKGVNYHMALNGLAYERAIANGVDDIDAFIKKTVREIPTFRDDVGLTAELRQTYEELDTLAKNHARRNTWTDPLTPGSVGKSAQDFVIKHPMGRLFMPFVRTPVNLLKFVGERTPLVRGRTKRYKDAVKATQKAGAMTPEHHAANTRMLIGTGLYLSAGTAAYNGILSGNGPANPAERAALLATGWQPNSVKITNRDGSVEYISFNRTDPFGLFLGIAATLGETIGMLEDKDLSELAIAATVAVAETLQSKSYFTGITQLVSALDQPDIRFKRLAERYLGSLVPNALAAFNQQVADDTMREVDGWLDVLRARIPGLSASLPPRRNIFGEVITYAHGLGPDTISPFFTRTSANTLVNREIDRLSRLGGGEGFGATMRVYNTLDGVELDPEQRDRLIVLSTGDPSRNGSDIREGLTKLMRTSKYKAADDSRDGKQFLIREFFGKRRRRGRRALLRENADLRRAVKEAKRVGREALRNEAARQANTGGTPAGRFIASLGETPRNLS